MKVKLLSPVQPSATPWTAAYQAPPPLGFSRQEYWSGPPTPQRLRLLRDARRQCSQSFAPVGPGPVTPEKPPELASDPDLPAAQRAACPATCSFGDLFSHHQTEPSADRAIRGCPGSENGQVLWLQRGEPWGAWVAAVFPPLWLQRGDPSGAGWQPSFLQCPLSASSPVPWCWRCRLHRP